MFALDYTASASRISALSERLLTLSEVERMLAAPDAEEAFRILNDLEWASNVPDAEGSEDFERVIENGLFDIKLTFFESVPSEELLQFIFLPFDLENAKISLGAITKNLEYEDIRDRLSDLSYFEKRSSYDILQGNESKKIRFAFIERALKNARGEAEKTGDIERANHILDEEFYAELNRLQEELGNIHLKKYFSLLIDSENIKTIVRCRNSEKLFFLYPNTKGDWISREEALQKIMFSPLNNFLKEGISLSAEQKDLSNWETELSLTVLDMMSPSRYMNPFGAENLMVFLATKIRNAEVIRTILVGKRNQFSDEEIRHSLTPFLPFLPKK